MSNRPWDAPAWLRSVKRMEERFREPAWVKSFNQTSSRINHMSQLHAIWAQNDRIMEYSLQLEKASTLMQEAAKPILQIQHRFRDMLNTQSIDRVAQLAKRIYDAQGNVSGMLPGFEWSLISFGSGTLIYDGQEFTLAELSVELEDEIALLETHKSAPEVFQELKKRFWVITLISHLLFLIPDISETLEYYTEKVNA